MTRGKILFIDEKNTLFTSCEFNGDMHSYNRGQLIIETFQNGYFMNFDDYEKYVEKFNGKFFGYEENLIRTQAVSTFELCIDKNFTDYLYIINGSNHEFAIISDGVKSMIPTNGMAIVHYKNVEEILSVNIDSNRLKKMEAIDKIVIEKMRNSAVPRDISRIEPIISELKAVWERHPDLRLGQLICNIVPEDKLYYIEDSNMLDKIRKWEELIGN